MPERPAVRDDSETEHPPPPELLREPRDDTDDADGAADHESHDPYQPL
jgi:hypothetical protein